MLRKNARRSRAGNLHACFVRHDDWMKLLENPSFTPRWTASFMIFKDKFETTLLLDDT
jgi:hypothetical protein